MTATLVFDYPMGWQISLPLACAALLLWGWAQHRRGLGWWPIITLTALRGIAMLLMVFLLARPVWIAKQPPLSPNRSVVLLLDRSESMSLEEGERTRYQQALGFARDHLLPALKSVNLPVQAMLFAQDAEPADGDKLANAAPNGKRTNLGGAFAASWAAAF